MRKTLLPSVLVLLLGACAGGTTSPQGPIALGFIGPLTGGAVSLGVDVLHGVQMAMDEVNAKGGIGGRAVTLVVEDGRCTGSDAANAAQKLVQVDRVTAIIGGLCSGETLAAAPIAEEARVVLLSAGSSSPDVTTAGDFVFRNYPSDALKSIATAKMFAKKGYKKIALISENTDFATAFRTSLKHDVGEDAFVFDEVVEPETKDYRTLMTRLRSVDFDVFFPNANGDAGIAAMVQHFREQGLTQPIFSHEVADSTTLGEVAKEEVEDMQLVTVPTAGKGMPFEEQFVAKYSAPQSSIAFAAHAYDATNVLLQAMTKAGTQGTAIRDALYELDGYDGVVGRFHFDENGDVVGIPFVLKEFRDGKTVEVERIPLD